MLHTVCTVFTLNSTANRGHNITGTLHHPAFSQISNVIGSTQNPIPHIHSFIHKQTLLAAPVLPTFSQTSSHNHVPSRNPRSLPMMPFQHVAVPQDENLNYITGSVSLLWRALFICGRSPRLFLGSDSKWQRLEKTRKSWRRRTRDGGKWKKFERCGVLNQIAEWGWSEVELNASESCNVSTTVSGPSTHSC